MNAPLNCSSHQGLEDEGGAAAAGRLSAAGAGCGCQSAAQGRGACRGEWIAQRYVAASAKPRRKGEVPAEVRGVQHFIVHGSCRWDSVARRCGCLMRWSGSSEALTPALQQQLPAHTNQPQAEQQPSTQLTPPGGCHARPARYGQLAGPAGAARRRGGRERANGWRALLAGAHGWRLPGKKFGPRAGRSLA